MATKLAPSTELVIYGWCIMSNHVHLIISAKENNVSDVLGNFKKFTSKKLIAAIQNNTNESRKEWMIKLFKEAGELNSRNTNFQFWKQDNEPKIIYTPDSLNRNWNTFIIIL